MAKVINFKKYKKTKEKAVLLNKFVKTLDVFAGMSLHKPVELADYDGPAKDWDLFDDPEIVIWMNDNNVEPETEIFVWLEEETPDGNNYVIQVKSKLIDL